MNYRIGEGKKWLLVGVAGISDALEIILLFTGIGTFASLVIGTIQYGGLWFLFKISGVDFFGIKRIKRQITTGILESIPGIAAIPFFTITVWITIKESRTEDEERENGGSGNNSNILRSKLTKNLSKPGNITRAKKS